MDLILWHNPRCSKSRAALALLEEAGAPLTLRRYLDDPPTEAELRALQSALDLPAIAMMRPKEAAFREMGLSRDMEDATLIAAMARQPKLIERPVLIAGERAVIGRPPERVLTLL
ncbi:arsenate reductase (glutaredoxin) [Pseudoponticoccus marisrubri]|uniref:Arsenate reductase n=1 Tax=Pseudoponticoccus marisrubri TaxID=1685382 RepID=A0A0W7WIM2_9RHOB|nr:arsenate reductase (glutaredoxin) [Pseudoponticoccus marisrubri]KUF10469.1 arsenate reductase [Pseudoponticoccus marisrubri]